MKSLYRILLALLSSLLCFISFTGYDIWYFAFVSWVPVFIAVDGLSFRKSFLYGWLMGTVAHFAGYYWIPQTLRKFGEFNIFLSILFSVLLCLYQGGGFALTVSAINYLKRKGKYYILGFAVIFVAIEKFYPRIFPIFWGNTLYRCIIPIQSAELLGVSFVSFLLALSNFSVLNLIESFLMKRRSSVKKMEIGFVVFIWVVNIVFGYIRLIQVDEQASTGEKIKVGVVQGNMGLMEKRMSPARSIETHRRLSLPLEKKGANLIVWSESSVNYIIGEEVEDLKKQVLGELSTPVIFGAIRRENGKMFNTAFIVDGEGRVKGYYDKVHLLAFGEYIPLGNRFPILYRWSPNTGRFTPGDEFNYLPFGHHKIGMMICYEDILPAHTRKIVRWSDGDVDLFVNITNDAWFGETKEPYIHLGLSIFRSVENRKWLIRATNSGVSAAIDPAGRIVKQTGLMSEDSFLIEVSFMKVRTFYQYYGWLFPYVCMGAAPGLYLPVVRRKKKKRGKKRRW